MDNIATVYRELRPFPRPRCRGPPISAATVRTTRAWLQARALAALPELLYPRARAGSVTTHAVRGASHV